MKKLLYILIIFPIVLFSQDYPRIDTLNFGKNVWLVKQYCQYDSGREELLYKYYFNKNGRHITTYSGFNSKIQNKKVYTYNDFGELINVKYQDYTSPKNDSIEKCFYLEENQILYEAKDSFPNEEMSNLYKKYKLLYEKIDPEKAKWEDESKVHPYLVFKRNSEGRDSIIEVYQDYNTKDCYLDEIVSFYYDRDKKLIRKIWVDIPHANIFKFQGFKPNSADFEDSLKNFSGKTDEKKYFYFDNKLAIDCYVNGQLMGYEQIITDKKENTKSILQLDAKMDTLSYYKEFYDSDNKLICRQRIKETGYNGFGYSLDYVATDMEILKYDLKGRLESIDEFVKGKHTYKEIFKIIEQ